MACNRYADDSILRDEEIGNLTLQNPEVFRFIEKPMHGLAI